MKRSTIADVASLDEPPAVGQRYRVPTVRYGWYGLVSDWPVMGPKHDDVELDFELPHYHIDLRFLTVREQNKLASVYKFKAERLGLDAVVLGASGSPIHAPVGPMRKTEDGTFVPGLPGPPLPAPILKVRTCRTNEHRYPWDCAAQNPRFVDLRRSYAGRACGRDAAERLICPHKGFAIGSLKPDASGHVVCPLHGLRINVREGRVA